MATPNLPSTTSIIDYLSAQGKDSSYTARKKMYDTSGFTDRLGSYTGASNQNLALLDYLKTQSGASTPTASSALTALSINNSPKPTANFGAFSPFINLPSTGGATTPAFGKGTPTTPPTPLANKPATLSAYKEGMGTNVPVYTASDGTRFTTSSDVANYGKPNAETAAILGTKATENKPFSLADMMAGIQQVPGQFTPAPAGTGRMTLAPTGTGTPAVNGGQGGTQAPVTQTPTPTPQTPNLDTLRSTISMAEKAIADAKARGIDTTAAEAALQESRNMLAQGEAEGDKPFKGSIFDRGGKTEYAPTNSETPDEADLINQFLESNEGKLLLEKAEKDGLDARSKAETAKQALETKYASDKTALEDKLAVNGLTFSGIRGTQVKALSDALASSVLATDRELASALLDADIDFRSKILDGVAALIKSANDDEDDAIKQLNLMGYALYGGQLYPTLAAQNAEADDIRANANLAISQRRLELAEEANIRAANKAADDETHVDDLLNFLADIQDPENEGASEAEQLIYAMTYYPNLKKDEISAAIANAPASTASITSNATSIVDAYFNPTWGNFDATDLEDAKREARKLITGLGTGTHSNKDLGISYTVNTQQDLQRLLATIDTITLEEVK